MDASTADAGALAALAAPVTAYLGATLKLDGSSSMGPAGFTYAWSITSAPAGAVTNLADATTATPTLAADRPGAYALALTVASGGATASTSVTATLVDPAVFYLETSTDGGVRAGDLKVVGAVAGDGGVPVACSSNDAGASYVAITSNAAQLGADVWEGPAGTPARVAYVYLAVAPDGGALSTALYATTSASTCATAPTVLDRSVGEPVATRPFEQPSFSPSGSRIAYVKNDATGSAVTTVAFDGSQARSIGAFYAYGDGGSNPTQTTGATGSTTRPVWIDETNVAWLEAYDGGWQVVSATDAAGSATKVVLRCGGTMPTQLGFLPNGDVLVSQGGPKNFGNPGAGNSPARNLVVYGVADATTKACGAPRTVSGLTADNTSAYAFALSPDRTRVAYLVSEVLTTTTRITNLDGTGTTVLPGGNDAPRWSGEGRFLSYGLEASTAFDAGPGIAVAAMLADGGSFHAAAIAAQTSGETAATIGNGYAQFCAMGRAFGPGVTFFGILGIAGLRIARRRKR